MVVDTLRERIRNGEFAPGERLPTQGSLQSEFGVSRSAVREALAALAQDGLLTGVGRGASPTVADPGSTGEAPRSAGVELADRLHAAFQAQHVTIDSFSLTTETLNNALAWPKRQIMDASSELTGGVPETIRARVLIPSQQTHLAIPRLIDDPDDPRPLQRLRDIQRTYVNVLSLSLDSLRKHGVSDVSLEIRTVPITPTQKLYLLNGVEALTGYYRVVENPDATYQNETLRIHDVLGLNSMLFRSYTPESRDEQEAAFVAESQLFFDSLWDTIAQPFPS